MRYTQTETPGSGFHPRDRQAVFTYKTDKRTEEETEQRSEEKKKKKKQRREKESEKKMGVEKQLLRPGTGPKPLPGQNVTVHCTGKNGDLTQKFWRLPDYHFIYVFLDPGQTPFSFKIGQGSVIKGWDEGVIGMQIGEVARLRCTPDYAYGAGGFPAWGIQPNSVLEFEIEVLSVN
ncbi:hypothetical protein V8G54_033901 [Vigna mungo]|uniref:peptidylprolyl isomerase n=1 Tax=Vigna mungo TaxID=3915 RepID=A0AAQ3RJF3_VIGMU